PIQTRHVDIQTNKLGREACSKYGHGGTRTIGNPRPKTKYPYHLMQCIGGLTIIVNDQTFNHLILQNDVAHNRHVVTCQLRNGFSEGRISQQSEKGRKEIVIRKLLGNYQVVTFMKKRYETQIQGLRSGGDSE